MEEIERTEVATTLQKESHSRALPYIIGLLVAILVCLMINLGATSYLIYRSQQPATEGTTSASEALPAGLDSAQGRTELLDELRIPFNEQDNERLYGVMDPLVQIELTREQFDERMLALYQIVGQIESGVYSHYEYQGLAKGKKWFVLYYRIQTEHGLMMLKVSVAQADQEPYGVVGFHIDAN